MDEERFPELIRKLYGVVAELETMFPGRPFTPDGHMVGSIAECYAQHFYGVDLATCSTAGHDGLFDGCRVEVKATQGTRVAFRSEPDRLLVFQVHRDGNLTEIYNGPGTPVWALVAHKQRPKNGQYSVSVAQLRKLMENVPPVSQIPQAKRSSSLS